MSRRTRSVGGRSRSRRVSSSWDRFRRSTGTVLVLVLVVMVFIAGLMLDTTAVLSLAFGWIWRVWKRAPLETSLAAVALIAGTLAVFGRRGAETPEPRERRPKPKSRNVAQPANKRRPAQRARQKAPTETSEPENADAVAADADAGATVQPRKKAARRKSVKADA